MEDMDSPRNSTNTQTRTSTILTPVILHNSITPQRSKPSFIQSISVISQPPPPYPQADNEGPPSYKTLFPKFFRTFSKPATGDEQDDGGDFVDGDDHSGAVKDCKIVCSMLFVILLVTIGIIYLIFKTS